LSDLNQCSFIGRLGKSPEMRYTPAGKAIASFSIAVSEKWKDKQTGEQKEKTEWINIVAFGKLAEICGEYLEKGKQVFVQGKFKTDKYEKDGVTKYSTKIVANDMKMLGSKSDSTQPSQSSAGGSQDFDEEGTPF